MAYFPSFAVVQNVISDTANSNNNASQINSGSTWNSAGAGTSTLGVAGIQVSIKTDQNCTIYVDQSPDGTNWDITDTINYWASLGGAGWTIQAVNAYVRVRVKNIGLSTTSYIRLFTYLCPVIDAVPRSLDSDGNFKVAIESFTGLLGSQVAISPQGNLRTVVPTRLVGAAFSGTAAIDSNFWVTTGSTGSGAASVVSGELVVTTGGTSASTGRVTSVRYGRYVAGTSNYVRIVLDLPVVTGANVRRWGAYDGNDGFYFMDDYSDGANHVLKLVCRKGGSDTNTIASGSFNGDHGSEYTLGSNAFTCEIYISNKKVYFVIDDVLIHTFTASSATLSSTLTLPLRFETVNSVGNSNTNTLDISAASINRLGQLKTDSIYKYISGAGTNILKYGAGRLHKIILGNSPGTTTCIAYDNISATGSIITSLGTTNSSATPKTIDLDCPFFTGLTIVTTGASSSVTVIYE